MNTKQNRFALETDARSRVTIYLINRANSKSICQFGDLTHDPHGGFISGDGQVRVSADASYIAFKLASIQDSDYILSPSNSWTWAPAPGAMVIPPELCERIRTRRGPDPPDSGSVSLRSPTSVPPNRAAI